jgi:hypothetical protein
MATRCVSSFTRLCHWRVSWQFAHLQLYSDDFADCQHVSKRITQMVCVFVQGNINQAIRGTESDSNIGISLRKSSDNFVK